LELGAWIARSRGEPLVIAAADDDDGLNASRTAAYASLVVQRLAGIEASSVAVRADVLEVSAGASLVVLGLSDRWMQEGVGAVRSALAARLDCPLLLARAGPNHRRPSRYGDVSRAPWSRPGAPPALR